MWPYEHSVVSTIRTNEEKNFSSPTGVAVDSVGNILVADFGHNKIKKILLSGEVKTIEDSFPFQSPTALTCDPHGNIFVADSSNNRIIKISKNKIPEIFVPSLNVRFPHGIAIDKLENIFVTDYYNHCIHKIFPDNTSIIFAGKHNTCGFTDGPGTEARFNLPTGITTDNSNNVYVADSSNLVIRKISTSGYVSTLKSHVGELILLKSPFGVAVDMNENIVVVEYKGRRIIKITPEGHVSILAGAEKSGYADGEGRDALFSNPVGGCIDGNGNILVADYNNNLIRKITQIDMFADMWPKSQLKLARPCQIAILETLYCFKSRATFIPPELVAMIVRTFIMLWYTGRNNIL